MPAQMDANQIGFAINAWLHKVPARQLTSIMQLREQILALGDDIREEFKWQRPCYRNSKGLMCYLGTTANHAMVGFHLGAMFEDPAGLLTGKGKQMRHLKLTGNLSYDSPEVAALLAQAYNR
ncbi:DUF1801 domain-containing protein [Shewanella sp. GXUN23E]|uniref:DUF1801 domain-containing protein n=1 Tax=Shewanella sp. GXUN23E TaxID=3422498 RepID=UPI003D7D0A5A